MKSAPTGTRRRVVSSTSADRFAARTRRRRLRTVLRFALVLVAIAVMGGAVWMVGWSSVLALRTVHVEGVGDALTDEVRSVAAAPVGQPLARVDTGEIEHRVAAIDEVATVTVSRSWPHDLVIKVRPRTPAALLEVDGKWQFVDATGAVFGPATGRPKNLVVIDSPAADNAAEVREAAVEVAHALPAEVLGRLERIAAHRISDIHLVLEGGADVVWGSSDRSERKAAVLAVLLNQKAKVYDVSAPERPAIQP